MSNIHGSFSIIPTKAVGNFHDPDSQYGQSLKNNSEDPNSVLLNRVEYLHMATIPNAGEGLTITSVVLINVRYTSDIDGSFLVDIAIPLKEEDLCILIQNLKVIGLYGESRAIVNTEDIHKALAYLEEHSKPTEPNLRLVVDNGGESIK